jgi:hypothetical protein
MSTTSFVVISSKYKTADSRSTTDFTYAIGQSLEASAVAIKSISIPNVQYNITNYNNKLVVYYGDATPPSVATITLPEGQYNITSFMSALQALMRDAVSDDSLTITQNDLTGKLTISTDTVPINISIDRSLSPLAKVIGLGDKEGGVYPAQVSLLIESPFLPSLGGLKNFYLASRVLSQGYNGIFKNGETVGMVMNIPVDVPYGAVEHYDPQDIRLNLNQFSRPSNIQWIDIKVLDEDLNTVDLHGADIEIVLKIYTGQDLGLK